MKTIALAMALCLMFLACGKAGKHAAHGPSEYAGAFKDVELTSQLLENYIRQGEFDFVRVAAGSLKTAVEKLRAIAKKELPPKMKEEAEEKLETLVQACEGMLRAVPSGDREAIRQPQSRIKTLLGEVKEYAQHAKAPHQDH